MTSSYSSQNEAYPPSIGAFDRPEGVPMYAVPSAVPKPGPVLQMSGLVVMSLLALLSIYMVLDSGLSIGRFRNFELFFVSTVPWALIAYFSVCVLFVPDHLVDDDDGDVHKMWPLLASSFFRLFGIFKVLYISDNTNGVRFLMIVLGEAFFLAAMYVCYLAKSGSSPISGCFKPWIMLKYENIDNKEGDV